MSNLEKCKIILQSSAGKISVIAGPGSGKTKEIIIPKAQQLIESGLNEKEILLLSFSRLSALDLKRRVKSVGGKLRASTVHSFCLSFLLNENNHDIRNRINSFLLDFEKTFLIADLKLIFPSKRKDDLSEMLDKFCAGWAVEQHDTVFEQNDEQKQFKRAVVNWLEKYQSVMVDEIIYFALDLAKKHPTSDFLEKYKYILVDEYQDLNKLEQEFIDFLSNNSSLVIVVGDPDQSIYGFKFANREGIKSFAGREDVEDHILEYCGRCSKKILAAANQLLLQEDPTRTVLPLPLENKPDGELDIRTPFNFQEEEFSFVFDSILTKLRNEVSAKEILILVPRRKLGKEFLDYVNANSGLLEGINAKFSVVAKIKFSEVEQKHILLFSLIAQPNSLLHIRAYLGLGDDKAFSEEVRLVEEKYGSILNFLNNHDENDFPKKLTRVRRLCQKATNLKEQISSLDLENTTTNLEETINKLFPADNADLADLNRLLNSLVETDDNVSDLYQKFIDYVRNLPVDDQTVRIMTIMGSKGLDAEHVYIIGANAGNIPGENRSVHMSQHEFLQEQRRLLYVGFTRAKDSLTVTWSKNIPFGQSMSHHTQGVGTIRHNGHLYRRVSLCSFLQDL